MKWSNSTNTQISESTTTRHYEIIIFKTSLNLLCAPLASPKTSEIVCCSLLCRRLAGRGAVRGNRGFPSCFRFCRKEKLSFWPCRQRTEPCDKMALYNFKKIMVVPTAKVRFIRRVDFLTERYFTRFICQVWGENIFKKGEGILVGRKHVSSSSLQLYNTG